MTDEISAAEAQRKGESQIETYKRKRLEAFQREIEEVQNGTHATMVGKVKKLRQRRDEKLERVTRRKAWHARSVEICANKDKADAAEWLQAEAKRKKEELNAEIFDGIDALKRELRTRGADGKAAETVSRNAPKPVSSVAPSIKRSCCLAGCGQEEEESKQAAV